MYFAAKWRMLLINGMNQGKNAKKSKSAWIHCLLFTTLLVESDSKFNQWVKSTGTPLRSVPAAYPGVMRANLGDHIY